jgi:hypothetical protein
VAEAKAIGLDLTSLFPGIKEYQDKKYAEQCLAENSSVERNIGEILRTAIGKIQASIPVSVPPKPGCTGIDSLLRFVLTGAEPGSTFLLITDAEETCSKDAISGIRIPAGSKVVLFLVPKKGLIEKEGPEALKRGEAWQASIPGLVVRPYTDLENAIDSVAIHR